MLWKKGKGQHATPTHTVTHRKKVRQLHILGEGICVFRNEIETTGFFLPKWHYSHFSGWYPVQQQWMTWQRQKSKLQRLFQIIVSLAVQKLIRQNSGGNGWFSAFHIFSIIVFSWLIKPQWNAYAKGINRRKTWPRTAVWSWVKINVK